MLASRAACTRRATPLSSADVGNTASGTRLAPCASMKRREVGSLRLDGDAVDLEVEALACSGGGGGKRAWKGVRLAPCA
eukprot:364291-Chlamydomonas_euryale.AAC.2